MSSIQDGPASALFHPVSFQGNASLSDLAQHGVSAQMAAALQHAPSGACIGWGIPFQIDDILLLHEQPVTVEIQPTTARWFIFMHTSDLLDPQKNPDGFISPMRGRGQLGQPAARYVIRYADGSEESAMIRRRFQIGTFQRNWGENCFEAVAHHKPHPFRAGQEQSHPDWGFSQTRATAADDSHWDNWLWAWENPHPERQVSAFRFEPGSHLLVISAISGGDVAAMPLRWQSRAKACLRLPQGTTFLPNLDEHGLLKQIQLDLGQVISATPRLLYPNQNWPSTYNNQMPLVSENEVLVEYTAHPEACFHLDGERVIPVAQVAGPQSDPALERVPPASQLVKLRVVERANHAPVPVKLHIHGSWGEYLAPIDRHRILNPAWFQDYSVDFVHLNWSALERVHSCTYINGETTLKLPLGEVYLEVSKGFEIRPVRQVIEVTPGTEEVVIEIEKVLPWRERGWVTADTHVHFLSPVTAMLEGSAEGVNIINLLASQWGELMTNVGDFDGRNTWGSREAGGDGEYLVRVGTENRQHVLGHISLLGYQGPIIAPMTTGGPDESAIGDPVEILLIEWARQCKAQGGLVILPHFPNPRAEHAASLLSGEIDALEMTSWGNHYLGIDPYSLSDWYRYLNCGYLVPVVGGTDKMGSSTAVGTVRTYAHLDPQTEFTYDTWKATVRRAETFVSYGPLLEFSVDGAPMGGRILMPAGGGTVDVTWQVASVTVPISRVELVVNGEICQSQAVAPDAASGHWSVRVEKSAWLAWLVRGHYADQPEIITAHSSPVMVQVAGSSLLAAADAVTILEQIEGALTYLDIIATRAEERANKRMRLALQSAQRTLHNRMHEHGYYHEHNHPTEPHD
jgi:hypothetical protein